MLTDTTVYSVYPIVWKTSTVKLNKTILKMPCHIQTWIENHVTLPTAWPKNCVSSKHSLKYTLNYLIIQRNVHVA
jgi:hypothetical protein